MTWVISFGHKEAEVLDWTLTGQHLALSVAAGIAAIISAWSTNLDNQRIFYFFKPLTILLIILLAGLGEAVNPGFRLLILLGLILSAVGDVLLMLPGDLFLPGLGAFFLTHLLYSAAFWGRAEGLDWQKLVPLMIMAVLFTRLIGSGIREIRIPVYAYMAAIVMMVWLAWCGVDGKDSAGVRQAFVGALLFMLSDMVLAWERFRRHSRAARSLNLLLYFSGQWLIALSALAAGARH